ncbi:molybdopterin-dependent oxidoreductase [Alkalihalobacillus oceani]|uniref:molybdopterin-dependent oxidoreductase n=1 Tax=Halalkalibacter oceani TaxID=1653776 RepID=UPI00203C297A|nr:molybdopterin-dependent oxidoreductase [Halalkalibacter oceani]MCM3759761.1 molybdopterin-dependent oxidoreductase [Halalkalibacter oceani]
MKWLNRVHLIHGILLVLLLVTGLCLYMTTTRTWFNQLGVPLVSVHIVIAVLYIAVVCYSIIRVGRYLLKKPRASRFNFWLHAIFFFLWATSGAVMYWQASFPVTLRNGAVVIHDWTTFLYLPWLLVHSVGHLFSWKVPWPDWWTKHVALPPAIAENKFERRDFLKLSGLTVLFLMIGSWLKWLTPVLSAVDSENKRRGYFRIYNVTNDYPRYEPGEWSLTIDGLTNKSETITYYDLPRFPATTIVDDFHCVTGWSVRHVEMKGIKVKDLMTQLGIEAQSDYVTAYSGDEMYFDSFLTTQLLDEEALLVYELDGEPLKHAMGFPCRLYHPEMYGYKSVKWINRLEFTEKREIGYWQQSGGYDLNGYL